MGHTSDVWTPFQKAYPNITHSPFFSNFCFKAYEKAIHQANEYVPFQLKLQKEYKDTVI